MDEIFILLSLIELPICQDCKQVNNIILTIKDFQTNQIKKICSNCAKNLKILGFNYKEEQQEIKIDKGVEYIEIPCPGCPNKKIKILKEVFDKRYQKDK